MIFLLTKYVINNNYNKMHTDDITCKIFSFLEYEETKKLPLVCQRWNYIVNKTDKSFLSEIVYENHTDLHILYRHYKTIRRIHAKYIENLDLWLTFDFKHLRTIIFERCSFNHINSFITSETENIKLERCNEDCVNKDSLEPDLKKYPNLKTLTVS